MTPKCMPPNHSQEAKIRQDDPKTRFTGVLSYIMTLSVKRLLKNTHKKIIITNAPKLIDLSN